MLNKYKAKLNYLVVWCILGAGLTSCRAVVSTSSGASGGGSEAALSPVDLNADGATTLSGQVADGETTVEIANLSATEYVRQVVVDLGAHFLPANICTGKTIFGRAGTAVCNSLFGDLTASNMHRDTGTTAQMTLTAEKASGSYASGYREVPDVNKDDDGYFTSDNGCSNSGGAFDTCSTVVNATRPSLDCGTGATIDARIADCVTQNGASATWAGSTKGNSGEATWKLVTRKNGAEVWRDERTGLVWSDTDGSYPNWCHAAGNKQADDPGGYCNDPSYQDQTTPYSACSEFTGAQPTFSGDDYSGGTYSDLKGGMGKLSSPSVRWRLPTITDFKQADINGIRFVLPNITTGASSGYGFWSATVFSANRYSAWYFLGSDGSLGNTNYDRGYNSGNVLCVGR